MWIRDSTQQLLPYLEFAPLDTDLQNLILGAIKVQGTYLAYNPYANAFRMPPDGPQHAQSFSDRDRVIPKYDPKIVWEAKVGYNIMINKSCR
jgi:meiotically up-regulated gene 157 (Mug157) protein